MNGPLKMRKIVAAALLLVFVTPAFAQTQTGVIPGFMAAAGTDGCPSSNACFVPYSAAFPFPVTPTAPGQRTIVPLDVATVTTGGTAVNALIAGHRTAGGFLYNPIGATINLCINEQGVASGTTSAGALTCIQPGQSYTLAPAAGAVSVVTSDSSHPFSGYGLN